MDPLSDIEELRTAWRALARDNETADGWMTIPLSLGRSRRFRAGRRFPGNEEALLIGFSGPKTPAQELLPQAQGFLISKVDLPTEHSLWLALSRRPTASEELFILMVFDVIGTLAQLDEPNEQLTLEVFLSRVRAWQEFMRRGTESVLGSEAEIGLVGELVFLRSVLDAGLSPVAAVDAWVGPSRGVQDFVLGTGAVEVKTTVATSGFLASVDSLAQLDDSESQPLFLAAMRLRIDPSGMSLPEVIAETRDILVANLTTTSVFNAKLLQAGYLDGVSAQYRRRFLKVEGKIVHITDEFPRLVRANVPIRVVAARYQIDCGDQLNGDLSVPDVLQQVGLM